MGACRELRTLVARLPFVCSGIMPLRPGRIHAAQTVPRRALTIERVDLAKPAPMPRRAQAVDEALLVGLLWRLAHETVHVLGVLADEDAPLLLAYAVEDDGRRFRRTGRRRRFELLR